MDRTLNVNGQDIRIIDIIDSIIRDLSDDQLEELNTRGIPVIKTINGKKMPVTNFGPGPAKVLADVFSNSCSQSLRKFASG